MNTKFNAKFFTLVLLASLALPGCRDTMSQDPADNFVSKKFPRQLEWIRSQIREFTQSERDKIVVRVQEDAKRTDLLKIAVIDSGVDIAHKDLQSQIDYRLVDGKLASAGIDIMGGGASGTHILVNPTLFAFGAKTIKNGLIDGPVESPLLLIKQTNEAFQEIVHNAIQNDADLKGTVFAQVPKESFSIGAGYGLGFDSFEEKLKKYEETATKNVFLTPDEMTEKDVTDFRLTPDAHDIAVYLNAPFIKHGDRFIKIIRDSLVILDQKTDFRRNITNLNTFMKAKNDSASINEAVTAIREGLNLSLWGIDAYDPQFRLELMFSKDKKYRGLSLTQAADLFVNEGLLAYEEYEKSPDLTEEKKKMIVKAKKELANVKLAARNLQDLQKNSDEYRKMRSDLRRHVYRTLHPYILPEGNTNSHGTHVSGVIAKQDPRIRIVPVRVTTMSVAVSDARKNELRKRFISDFAAWSQLPIVMELKKEVLSEYSNLRISDAAILRHLEDYLKKNTLNIVFIDDVLKAVEAAGKNQIKLANVSLGTTFQKDHSLKQKAQSYVSDLFAEFARYRIGQTMGEKAPGTLFMIATGNDGGWVDGVSKTGFPVGITSARLLKVAKQMNLPDAPNNAIRNVLAVGSINPNGTLTPFTNILIDPKIPQIFSTGEEVNSSVPAKDLEKPTKLVEVKFSNITNTIINLRTDLMAISDPESDKKMERLGSDLNFLDNMKLATSLVIHMNEPDGRTRMSGTSMATPTVTGILGKLVLEKMTAENISSKDLYMDPRVMPEAIIKDAFSLAKLSPHSSTITIKMLADGIKEWEKSKAEIKQEKMVQKIFRRSAVKSRCEVVFQ
jgi:subtilisin family serine protease